MLNELPRKAKHNASREFPQSFGKVRQAARVEAEQRRAEAGKHAGPEMTNSTCSSTCRDTATWHRVQVSGSAGESSHIYGWAGKTTARHATPSLPACMSAALTERCASTKVSVREALASGHLEVSGLAMWRRGGSETCQMPCLLSRPFRSWLQLPWAQTCRPRGEMCIFTP